MLLDGKTALVTGASRGIGRAVALRLAEEGARVAINYAGNVKAAEEVKAAIEAAGGTAMLCRADIADSAAVEAMVDSVVKAFGAIDILVNNAGITRDTLLMRMKDEDFEKVLDTDMTAGLSEAVKEKALADIPLGKMGEPKDVANAVLFLASDQASYITGQVVNVDGGMVM